VDGVEVACGELRYRRQKVKTCTLKNHRVWHPGEPFRSAVGFFGRGVGGILGLGGLSVLGAFWFVDRGEGFYVEAFVVRVAGGGVDAEAF
jgi:hypothetical protein